MSSLHKENDTSSGETQLNSVVIHFNKCAGLQDCPVLFDIDHRTGEIAPHSSTNRCDRFVCVWVCRRSRHLSDEASSSLRL